jgi:hypothetical protein
MPRGDRAVEGRDASLPDPPEHRFTEKGARVEPVDNISLFVQLPCLLLVHVSILHELSIHESINKPITAKARKGENTKNTPLLSCFPPFVLS